MQQRDKIVLFVVIMIALAGPKLNITSIIWYVVAIISGACLGYWANKEKPIAAMVTNSCIIATFPFTYYWYVADRDTIFKFELIIPMSISLAISYLIGWILKKIIYSS